MSWLLDAQLASTLFMTGVIWFVQVVHYPLLSAVGESGFIAYEERHRVLTTWVVAPAMLIEAFSAAWLVRWLAATELAWLAWVGMGLVLLIWLTTACCSVPAHGALCHGFACAAHRRLVWTNWIRTIAWTLRAVLVLVLSHRLTD